MSNPHTLREIVEEKSYEEQIAALGISYARLDEVRAGIDAALAMHPEKFLKVDGTAFSIVKTKSFPGAPPIRLFFTYDAEKVNLWWIELMEDEPESADSDADAAAG